MCDILRILITITCLLFTVPLNALTADVYVKKALDLELSEHKQWHKLLYYKKSLIGTNKYKSEVLSNEFFVSNAGKVDPSAELVDTIKSFFSTSESGDVHPQCLFPARFIWLNKQLSFDSSKLPVVDCIAYKEWLQEGNITSASVVFATGYMSNPASFFGHMLLKFDSAANGGSSLLDTSLNFGAIVPDNENMLVYILNGLLGGYESGFTHKEYYNHHHLYAEEDLRDIWEYELDLTSEQLELLLAHSFELLGKKYNYYYLRQNCAYRMAELLKLVIDTDLYDIKTPWVLPTSIFINLADGESNLIKDIRLVESRQNNFYNKYKQLSPAEKQYLKDVVDHDKPLSRHDLSANQQARVLETLFDYYAFQDVKNPHSDLADKKRQALLERMLLQENVDWGEYDAFPPHKASKPSLIKLGHEYNHRIGGVSSLVVRPAYYDFLAKPVARVPYSKLSMMEFELQRRDDNYSLSRLDIVNVNTLNPSVTNLKGDNAYAWKLRLAWETVDQVCNNCGQHRLEYGFGKSAYIDENSVVYGMLAANIFDNRLNTGYSSGSFAIGYIGHHRNFSTHLNVEYERYSNSSDHSDTKIVWENRYHLNAKWDLNFSYQHNLVDVYAFSIGRYW